jgi:hypothetical protein
MLLKVAEANGIECFGIDLPGGDPQMFDERGAIFDTTTLQRFDSWNLLRDSWMAKMIEKVCRQQPADLVLCVFVGADHNWASKRVGGRCGFGSVAKTGMRSRAA